MSNKKKIHPLDYRYDGTDRPKTKKIQMVDAVKSRMENARRWLVSRGWILRAHEVGYTSVWCRRNAADDGWIFSNDRQAIESSERFSFSTYDYAANALRAVKAGDIHKAVGLAFTCGMLYGQGVAAFRMATRNSKSKKDKKQIADSELKKACSGFEKKYGRKPSTKKELIISLPEFIPALSKKFPGKSPGAIYRRLNELSP